MYRRNNLSGQLKRVLDKVESNIRENHQLANRIGVRGLRVGKQLVPTKPAKPLSPIFDDDLETDDPDTLDYPVFPG